MTVNNNKVSMEPPPPPPPRKKKKERNTKQRLRVELQGDKECLRNSADGDDGFVEVLESKVHVEVHANIHVDNFVVQWSDDLVVR